MKNMFFKNYNLSTTKKAFAYEEFLKLSHLRNISVPPLMKDPPLANSITSA